MYIRKALLVKSLRELLTLTFCLCHSNKRKPQLSKRKRSELVYISCTLKVLLKDYSIYSDLTKLDPLSTLKEIYLNSFANLKIQQLQKYKNYVIQEIDSSICETVYFGEQEHYLKSCSDEHKRSLRNYDCNKNEIGKHC